MKSYVCGFLKCGQLVAMVKKTRGPAAVRGKWNGIGGEINPGESPSQAMAREFTEETGLTPLGWIHFLSLKGDGWIVWFFAADTKYCYPLPDENDVREKLEWRFSSGPDIRSEAVSNLSWILPMAECVGFDPGIPYLASEQLGYISTRKSLP